MANFIPLNINSCFHGIDVSCQVIDKDHLYIESFGFELESPFVPINCYPNGYEFNKDSTIFGYTNKRLCDGSLGTSTESLVLSSPGICKNYSLQDKRLLQPLTDPNQEFLLSADQASEKYWMNKLLTIKLSGQEISVDKIKIKIPDGSQVLEIPIDKKDFFDYLEIIYTVKNLSKPIDIFCWLHYHDEVLKKIKDYFLYNYKFIYERSIILSEYVKDSKTYKDDLYFNNIGLLYPKDKNYQLPVFLVNNSTPNYNPILKSDFNSQSTVGIKFENTVKFLEDFLRLFRNTNYYLTDIPPKKIQIEGEYISTSSKIPYFIILEAAKRLASRFKINDKLQTWLTLKIYYVFLDYFYLSQDVKIFRLKVNKKHTETMLTQEEVDLWYQVLPRAKLGDVNAINNLNVLTDPRRFVINPENEKSETVYMKDVLGIVPRHSLYQVFEELFSIDQLENILDQIPTVHKELTDENIFIFRNEDGSYMFLRNEMINVLNLLNIDIYTAYNTNLDPDYDPDVIYEVDIGNFWELSKYRVKSYNYLAQDSLRKSKHRLEYLNTPNLFLFEVRWFESIKRKAEELKKDLIEIQEKEEEQKSKMMGIYEIVKPQRKVRGINFNKVILKDDFKNVIKQTDEQFYEPFKIFEETYNYIISLLNKFFIYYQNLNLVEKWKDSYYNVLHAGEGKIYKDVINFSKENLRTEESFERIWDGFLSNTKIEIIDKVYNIMIYLLMILTYKGIEQAKLEGRNYIIPDDVKNGIEKDAELKEILSREI